MSLKVSSFIRAGTVVFSMISSTSNAQQALPVKIELWDQDLQLSVLRNDPSYSQFFSQNGDFVIPSLVPFKLIAHNGKVIIDTPVLGKGASGVGGHDGHHNGGGDVDPGTSGSPGQRGKDLTVISDSQSKGGGARSRGVEVTMNVDLRGGSGGAPGRSFNGDHLPTNWCAEHWNAQDGVEAASAGRGGNLTIQSVGDIHVSASIDTRGGMAGSGGSAGHGFAPDCLNGDAAQGKPGGAGGFVKVTADNGADVYLTDSSFDLRGGGGGDGGDGALGIGDSDRTAGGQGGEGGDGANAGYFKIIASAAGSDVYIEESQFLLEGGWGGGGGDGGAGSPNYADSKTCSVGSQCVVWHASDGGQGGATGNGGLGGDFDITVGATDLIVFIECEIVSRGGGIAAQVGDAGAAEVDRGIDDCDGSGLTCYVGVTATGAPASPGFGGDGGVVTITGGYINIEYGLTCDVSGASVNNLLPRDGASGAYFCCDDVLTSNGGQGQFGADGGSAGNIVLTGEALFDDLLFTRWVCPGCGGNGGDGGRYGGYHGEAGQSGQKGHYWLNGDDQDTSSCPNCEPKAGQDNTESVSCD